MNEEQIALGTPRARAKKYLVAAAALTVLAAPAVCGYLLGQKAAESAIYAAAYKEGRGDARAELAALLVKEQGFVAPIELPADADVNCETLTLLAARAGALLAIQSEAQMVSDQTETP